MQHTLIWILSMCFVWPWLFMNAEATTSLATKLSYKTFANVTNEMRYERVAHPEYDDRFDNVLSKFSTSQNHNRHHERNRNKWSMHHSMMIDDGENYQQQQQQHHHDEPIWENVNSRWIRHGGRFDDIKPKVRRRHEKRWNRNHSQFIGNRDHGISKLHANPEIQSSRMMHPTNQTENITIHWPVKKEAIMEGDVILGGLMMVHSREDSMMCGPIMPQGGIQALEAMLYTLDKINEDLVLLPNITIGAHILDDCDRDSYGLEMAVDFIKGTSKYIHSKLT